MAGRLPRKQQQNTQIARREETLPGDSLMNWLKSDKIQDRIKEVASKALDPVRFLRLCHVVVFKTPKLQECDRTTILQSVIEAAARGWELGFDAHLVPYKNKGRYECQLIADYRGLKKSVMRGGEVTKMKAGVVFEGEKFVWEEGGIEERFEYTPDAEIKGTEKMLFAWARAWFKDGTTQFTIVRRFEVLRAMASSRGSGSEYSPWQKFADRMWAKTALRRLCNEIGLSDEAMAVMRDDDNRSFSFGPEDDEPLIDPSVTVVDNTPDPEDRRDEAERRAAEREAVDIENQAGDKDPGPDPDDPEAQAPDEKPPQKPASRKKKATGKKASSKKKAAAAEKAPESSQEGGQSGEGRDADADQENANEDEQEAPAGNGKALVATVIEKGKKWGLTTATLVAGAESMQESSLAGGLNDAKETTLEKMSELLDGEEGAYAIEEHALSWQDRTAGEE